MGIIGFFGANVFYNALLPSVANEKGIDFVSSFGFALGCLGGGLLFLINVIMTLKPHWYGLPDAGASVRYVFLSVTLWWGGFSLFTPFWVPAVRTTSRQRETVFGLSHGLKQLSKT